MKRPSTNRKLSLEQCESRQLMAGNVSVAVNSGNLSITGDDAANGVQITQALNSTGQPIQGSYVISGLNQGNSATLLNGQAGPLTRTGITGNVDVNLRGGSDRFTTGIAAPRHLFANDLTVHMGEGNNSVNLNNISVRDDVTVTSGSGVDDVLVRGVVGNSIFSSDANLLIATGGGADRVSLLNFFVRNDASIDSGGGNFIDTVNLITGNIADDLFISTHDGADSVLLHGLGVNDDATIDTGSGSDNLTINESEMDELFALTGNNDDHVGMRNTFGRRATLNGGFGIDTLETSNVSFSEQFSVNGF